jgi:outer membrane biogenesis lipoprotein LolB
MRDSAHFRLLFLFFFIGLAACARPTTTIERPTPAGHEEMIARLKSRAEYYRCYQAKFHIQAQGPKGKIRLQAVMLTELPDRFRLEAYNPFGQTVGLLLLEGGASRLWLPSEKVVYGAARPETLVQYFLGVHIPLESFGYAVIATAPPSYLNDLKFYEKSGTLHGKVQIPSSGSEYTWDFLTEPLSLKSIEVREGGTEYTITYDPPADMALAETPKRVRFSSSQWEMDVTVDQLARSSQPQETAFQAPFPAGIREIKLDEAK